MNHSEFQGASAQQHNQEDNRLTIINQFLNRVGEQSIKDWSLNLYRSGNAMLQVADLSDVGEQGLRDIKNYFWYISEIAELLLQLDQSINRNPKRK